MSAYKTGLLGFGGGMLSTNLIHSVFPWHMPMIKSGQN